MELVYLHILVFALLVGLALIVIQVCTYMTNTGIIVHAHTHTQTHTHNTQTHNTHICCYIPLSASSQVCIPNFVL